MFQRFLNKKENTALPEAEGISEGLDEEKIVVELQPQTDIATKKILGAEALSRYKETDENILSPLMFVPLLESASVVSRLDLVVIEKVAETIARWKTEGRSPLPVSINLSRIDFSERGFIERADRIFTEHGVAPGQITFELHESALIDSYDMMRDRLVQLKNKGYHVAIDDFGSNGHVVLLPFDLPVDTIKFNMEYLYAAAKNEKGRQLVGDLIKSFSQANYHVIAESVETEEQRVLCEELNIPAIQGFIFAKAVDISVFEDKYMMM